MKTPSLLVHTQTLNWRHKSIPAGIAGVRGLGRKHGFAVEATEDPLRFRKESLSAFDAVLFLNTTGNILDAQGRKALRAFVENGGGFAGVHAACDTGYDWDWYGHLVGARFMSHPLGIQRQIGTVRVEDARHPSTQKLPKAWNRFDEWYDFSANPRGDVRVLATLDESTYAGGKMGADHPIIWCHEKLGGRAWYTGCGHTSASFSDPLFMGHLLGGLEYAMSRR